MILVYSERGHRAIFKMGSFVQIGSRSEKLQAFEYPHFWRILVQILTKLRQNVVTRAYQFQQK